MPKSRINLPTCSRSNSEGEALKVPLPQLQSIGGGWGLRLFVDLAFISFHLPDSGTKPKPRNDFKQVSETNLYRPDDGEC
jgi:hypothetical protein